MPYACPVTSRSALCPLVPLLRAARLLRGARSRRAFCSPFVACFLAPRVGIEPTSGLTFRLRCERGLLGRRLLLPSRPGAPDARPTRYHRGGELSP